MQWSCKWIAQIFERICYKTHASLTASSCHTFRSAGVSRSYFSWAIPSQWLCIAGVLEPRHFAWCGILQICIVGQNISHQSEIFSKLCCSLRLFSTQSFLPYLCHRSENCMRVWRALHGFCLFPFILNKLYPHKCHACPIISCHLLRGGPQNDIPIQWSSWF